MSASPTTLDAPFTAEQKTLQDAPSLYGGGAGAVDLLMRRILNRRLDHTQSEALWQECRAALLGRGDDETVRDVQASPDGELDTWDRDGLMDSLGQILADKDWPAYVDGASTAEEFFKAMGQALGKRNYARLIPAERQE